MEDIEFAKTDTARPHLFHGALVFATPGISESKVVERNALALEQRLRFARDRISPIDQRTEDVKKQRFHRNGHGLGIAHLGASRQSAGDEERSCRKKFLGQADYAAACRRRSTAGSILLPASCLRLQLHSIAISSAALLLPAYSVTPSPAAIAS